MRPILAGGAKAGLRAAERMLHRLRRRRAQALVARRAPVRCMAVLCYGNICRSPYAAAVLQRMLVRRGVLCQVSQGGFLGPDRPANDRAREVARARGTDLSEHRSRLVTAEEARTVDLVVVMEAYQARKIVAEFGADPGRVLVLGDLDPEPVVSRAIPDPYGLDNEVFIRTYERIDRCVAELTRLIDVR